MSELSELTNLLDRLDEAEIHYTLSSVSEGAIMVGIDAPGEHWEVEFMNDGDIEIEIFKSDGQIFDFSIIEDLFEGDEDE
ncbi:MAG: hypothetical protein BMS9Abin01_0917 [Gammaproteobacteria bacterium]|nr:MAG: hypothetical protein BMS9Abin01_0917 [Gammaproteobacteria bacterium]